MAKRQFNDILLFSAASIVIVVMLIFSVTTVTESQDTVSVSKQMASNLDSNPQTYYYYSNLSDEEKVIYVTLLDIIKNMETSHIFTDVSEASIQKVIDYVLADHPEIFYFSNYKYTQYTNGDLKFDTRYDYTPEVVETLKQDIAMYCASVLNQVTNLSDYDKVKFFYDYIITNTVYDENSINNQFVDSVVVDKVSVCNGYAKMFQLLCKESGIPCLFVKGIIRESAVTHAWNIVEIDNEYYHVDCTWGDTYHSGNSQVNYDFLCVPDNDIQVTHILSKKIEVPKCTSMACNYYVRQNLYFDTFNLARYTQLLDSANGFLTIRCENNEVLNEFTKYLFEEENIFKSLNSEDIYYRTNEGCNTFTVYFDT